MWKIPLVWNKRFNHHHFRSVSHYPTTQEYTARPVREYLPDAQVCGPRNGRENSIFDIPGTRHQPEQKNKQPERFLSIDFNQTRALIYLPNRRLKKGDDRSKRRRKSNAYFEEQHKPVYDYCQARIAVNADIRLAARDGRAGKFAVFCHCCRNAARGLGHFDRSPVRTNQVYVNRDHIQLRFGTAPVTLDNYLPS